jgi:hypothetical protein
MDLRIPPETVSASSASGTESKAPETTAPYQPPALERLGPWQAFTLQQSVPIFP